MDNKPEPPEDELLPSRKALEATAEAAERYLKATLSLVSDVCKAGALDGPEAVEIMLSAELLAAALSTNYREASGR